MNAEKKIQKMLGIAFPKNKINVEKKGKGFLPLEYYIVDHDEDYQPSILMQKYRPKGKDAKVLGFSK